MLNSGPPESVCHSLTVDVEDWYHVCGAEILPDHRRQSRVVAVTLRLLELLRGQGCRATFFMLGEVAEAYPDLAPAIIADGHELASHGWSHRLVTELTPAEFRCELERTATVLKQQTGCTPFGFRAPRWSLDRSKTPWAFEILKELGYRYDSSLTPLAAIGDPNGPRVPHLIMTPRGSICEFPPLVARSLLGNLPVGGGWGFRSFPYGMIERTLNSYQLAGVPGVLFVHPRELDPDSPRLSLPLLRRFLAYGPRAGSGERLEKLLANYTFKPLVELLDRVPLYPDTSL